jgi:serine/threonine protein kinase
VFLFEWYILNSGVFKEGFYCICYTGCLQEYVFENGPLPPETTLNYSYQLFEALDYLHQQLHVIHCDIKRERINCRPRPV